jgi:hypothetical protein
MKKIISILLGISMVLSANSIAMANVDVEIEGKNLEITKLSDEMLILTGEEGSAFMNARENDEEIIVSVECLQGSVEDGFFIYNKNDETIYSSYTEKTFYISDIASGNEIAPNAAGDVVSRKTHYISYAKLADAITPSSSDISIASAIITLIAVAQGVTISTTATVILALMSTSAWDAVRNGITNRSSNHGIKVVVATVEIQKHQGGKFVTGYKYEIESVSTY